MSSQRRIGRVVAETSNLLFFSQRIRIFWIQKVSVSFDLKGFHICTKSFRTFRVLIQKVSVSLDPRFSLISLDPKGFRIFRARIGSYRFASKRFSYLRFQKVFVSLDGPKGFSCHGRRRHPWIRGSSSECGRRTVRRTYDPYLVVRRRTCTV
jgi:hypothetical protein